MGRRRTTTHQLGRHCQYCDRALLPKQRDDREGRRHDEEAYHFNRRKFCDHRCSGRFTRYGPQPGAFDREDERAVAVPIDTGFPGAAHAVAADAPARCPKPGCGGWLRDETVALACLQCGHRLYIETWLRAYAERHGFGGIPADHMDERRPARLGIASRVWQAPSDPDLS